MKNVKSGKADTLTDKQYKSLITSIESGNHAIRNVGIITTSFKLGLRAGEIAHLKISDVMDSNGNIRDTLRLVKSYTKGNKHRDVPLSNPIIVKALKAVIDERKLIDGSTFGADTPLFRTQKLTQYSASAMTNMMAVLFANANLDKCSSHSGRRTCINNLVDKGVDLKKIATIVGHSNVQTTAGYVNAHPKTLADIMKAL